MFGHAWWRGSGMSGVDGAVLEELRAIRGEIQGLRETVGKSASREDLDDYVRIETFEAHVQHQKNVVEGWRSWVPIVVSCVALLWLVVGPYVHIGPP